MLMKRTLGRSRIAVSALGLGCWAIGGPFLLDGKPDGWGAVDDAESIRAIQRAIDLGVTFFDTADVYGTGHSECILGQAIKGRIGKIKPLFTPSHPPAAPLPPGWCPRWRPPRPGAPWAPRATGPIPRQAHAAGLGGPVLLLTLTP
jgi:hypothetical protein